MTCKHGINRDLVSCAQCEDQRDNENRHKKDQAAIQTLIDAVTALTFDVRRLAYEIECLRNRQYPTTTLPEFAHLQAFTTAQVGALSNGAISYNMGIGATIR